VATCNISTKVAYFLAGFGIGTAVALLFAPQSGEQTRKQIAEKAQKSKDYVAAKGREIREQAEDLVGQGRELINKQKDRLADALEAGRSAARDVFVR